MGARSSNRNKSQNTVSDGHLLEYFRNTFIRGGGSNYVPPPPPTGLTATGGVISDYTSGSDVYRAHIFTSSGTFDVSSIGNFGSNVEYLVVAGGGGGGGGYYGGGGGAGGLRTNLPGHPLATGNPPFTITAGPTSYLVTVGGGGAGSQSPPAGDGVDGISGQNSYFGPPSTPQGITAHGGGAGRGRDSAGAAGITGGSGGGTAYGAPGAGGFGLNPSTPAPVLAGYPLYTPGTTEGYPGGDNPSSSYYGSGGGGAGGAAPPGPSFGGPYGYPGGVGIQVLIAGPTNTGIGSTGPSTNYGYFAGGGGGGGPDNTNLGGYGGGGNGAIPTTSGGNGQPGTGGGGGGGQIASLSGFGGSGIVVVRYKIGSLTATAKATGGSISYYAGKTIHTFTSSGDFNNTSGSPLSAEVVLVGGGGGGGTETPNNFGAGGGGAGGYYVNSAVTISPGPNSIVVGSGGASVATTRSPIIPLVGGNGLPGGSTSAFGVTMGGGGGGTGGATAPTTGGASGGGVTYADAAPTTFTGAPFPGLLGNTPPAGWGHAGGPGVPSPGQCPGTGGGGAGGSGQAATGSQGGLAIQLPSTFRNPQASTGFGGSGPTTAPVPNGFDTSGKFWFAGGGGGSVVPAEGTVSNRGAGGIGPYTNPSPPIVGPWGGAGDGNNRDGNSPTAARSALANTGSGGGGFGYPIPISGGTYNHGGSGIVLIAYPS